MLTELLLFSILQIIICIISSMIDLIYTRGQYMERVKRGSTRKSIHLYSVQITK